MERSRFDYLEIGEAAAAPRPALAARPALQRSLKAAEVIGRPGERLGEFNCPWGVAVDGHGCLYVTDSLNHRVQKITPQGDVYGFGARGRDIGDLLNPQGIVVDNRLFIYVVEMGNSRVTKFSPTGELIMSFGSRGNMVGQFDRPAGLARDNYNNLYVADYGNGRVQKFDARGRFLATFGAAPMSNLRAPCGAGVDKAGNLYVTDERQQCIVVFHPSGGQIGVIAGPGTEVGPLEGPQGLALTPDGITVASEHDGDRVQAFTARGERVCAYGRSSAAASRLNGPSGVAQDRHTGDIYVADTMNHRIVKLRYE